MRLLDSILKRLALAGLLAALASGCTPQEPWTAENPELALRAFLGGLSVGDYTTVWEFLPDSSRETFTDAASATAGEDLEPGPEVLAIALVRVWAPTAYHIDRYEVTERSESHAVVSLHSIFGGETAVEMVRNDGRWTIDLLNAFTTVTDDTVPPQGSE